MKNASTKGRSTSRAESRSERTTDRTSSDGALQAGRRSAKPQMSRRKAGGSAFARAGGSGQRQRGKGKLNAALATPVTPDESLGAVIGQEPRPRPQVIKKLWEYIKAEGLQDTKDKRMINADDALRPVFGGKDRVDMFEMTKLVMGHLRS
jgi:upstream activation factor subunit UAF30